MPKYARVEANTITEERNFGNGQIPAHKEYLWTLIVNDIPEYDTGYQYLTGPVEVITANQVTRTWTLNYKDIDKLKNDKINEVWDYMTERLETGAVANVFITSANSYHDFGCDKETRENIIGINTAINGGIPIPDPRPWTPKGSIMPVDCSHVDLLSMGATILAQKDAHIQVYLTHKYNISVLAGANNHAGVAHYDYIVGWPS